MQDILVEVLKDILYVVIIGVVPILAKYVTDFLQAKREEILDNKEITIFGDTLVNALDLIHSAVDMVSQTYVDNLKKEGEFTVEAQKEALKLALATSQGLMSDDVKNLLQSAYGDLDEWMKVQIESYIASKKDLY